MLRSTLSLAAAVALLGGCASTAQPVPSANATPVKIEVMPSEALAFRANNLPDRSGSRRLRSGFANGGFLGEDAVEELVEETREELVQDLTNAGFAVSDTAATTIRVVIEDAKNNRPTFRQLSEEPSLAFDSFGVGGAELRADIIGASGEQLGTVDYRWFDNFDGDGFDRAVGTWTDAYRAISRFSDKTTDALRDAYRLG